MPLKIKILSKKQEQKRNKHNRTPGKIAFPAHVLSWQTIEGQAVTSCKDICHEIELNFFSCFIFFALKRGKYVSLIMNKENHWTFKVRRKSVNTYELALVNSKNKILKPSET